MKHRWYYVKLMEFRFLLQANEVVMMAEPTSSAGPRRRLSKNPSRPTGRQNKKWPLLVRSLSDSAKYRSRSGLNPLPYSAKHQTETKALTLSLSDSRLFSNNKSRNGGLLETTRLFDDLIVQNVTGLDKNLQVYAGMDKNDPETCSCGCEETIGCLPGCQVCVVSVNSVKIFVIRRKQNLWIP